MIDYTNSNLIIETASTKEGKFKWRSPSNLAIIKYWGKHGRQLPQNPSISLTLDNAYTETILEYRPKRKANTALEIEFYFHDEPHEGFRQKIVDFLSSITDIFPFLNQLCLKIRSQNSFPHSAGIASSASAMSALALCLCSLEHELFGTLPDDAAFRQKASFVARLGSGSACRSIYETAALWGKSGEIEHSSDDYAIDFSDKIHEVFHTFHDAILIVSKEEKKVSSRAGHNLMEQNPYATPRFQQARQRLHRLLRAMQQGDADIFGQIAEDEALTLHALMMTSNPSFILMHPNSLKIIEMVRNFRKDSGLPLYFSLDAGPNMHLLYPHAIHNEANNFIQTELAPLCDQQLWIADKVGKGPLQM